MLYLEKVEAKFKNIGFMSNSVDEAKNDKTKAEESCDSLVFLCRYEDSISE